MYDPAIGRFTSFDPADDYQNRLHRYNYCGGDGVNCVDPSGEVNYTLIGILAVAFIVGFIVGFVRPPKGTSWQDRVYSGLKYGLWAVLIVEILLVAAAGGVVAISWYFGWNILPPTAMMVAAEISATGSALAVAFRPSSSAPPRTTGPGTSPRRSIYRAVRDPELKQIERTGRFENPEGLEVKYFAETKAGAQQYGNMAEKAFKDGPYTIVETTIPESLLTAETTVVVDSGISTVVVRTEQLPQLSSPAMHP
jgi:hypothetical protein